MLFLNIFLVHFISAFTLHDLSRQLSTNDFSRLLSTIYIVVQNSKDRVMNSKNEALNFHSNERQSSRTS